MVTLSIRLLLGRYHAAPWNANPKETYEPEWPPSPWRILRALGGAWFATSQPPCSEAERNAILGELGTTLPVYCVPRSVTATTRHSQPHRQLSAGRPQFGLVYDCFRAVDPEDADVLVSWDLELAAPLHAKLEALCRRVTWLGRAESRVEIAPGQCDRRDWNCVPSDAERANCRLLSPVPGKFAPATLWRTSGEWNRDGKSLPDGTQWRPYRLSEPAAVPLHVSPYPSNLRLIQFALGGRVWPPERFIASIAERFRGSALKQFAMLQAQSRDARFTPEWLGEHQWSETLSGKCYPTNGERAQPITGHRHAYFLPQLDERGRVTQLAVWVPDTPDKALTPEEVEALCAVDTIYWGSGDYPLRVVPLPLDSPKPRTLFGPSKAWVSQTPFVPPRYARRRNGRPRPNESPQAQMRRLLVDRLGLFEEEARAVHIEEINPGRAELIRVHEGTRSDARRGGVRRGYRFRIELPKNVNGPIVLGHSAHFGLGLFVPELAR